MIHGTDDDVVVWQHSLAFVEKCVEEAIQLDYFPYPGHAHNVRGKDRIHLIEKVIHYVLDHNK
jgi:dipeptidyl-peptidase-4